MNLPEIHLSNLAYTVDHWDIRFRNKAGMFDLSAPYQRGSVWTTEQRRNLMKSLLMGLPVGNVIISALPYRENVEAHFRIVDGKQRVETIHAFFADGFTIPAEWLHPDMHTSTTDEVVASQLTDWGSRKIGNAQMGALQFDGTREMTDNPNWDPNKTKSQRFLFRHRTDEELLRAEAELYLLVNFGGVEQTDEDRARAATIAEG